MTRVYMCARRNVCFVYLAFSCTCDGASCYYLVFSWHCHIDDDMYVRIPPLVKLLSQFNGKKDPVYLGRSGSEWSTPRKVLKGAKIGTEGQGYHFAVGGMYCLSRAMLEMARSYIV